MGRKLLDLAGQSFGRLTVLSLDHKRGANYYWRCACACGASTVARGSHLKGGNIQSCGCARDGSQRLTHGGSYHPLYSVWSNMMRRCYDKDNPAYEYYGGRGIVVCPEWRDFRQFIADVEPRPPGLTLDRIDNNGPYAPDNFRWVTMAVQNRNRRPRGPTRKRKKPACPEAD